MKKEIYKRKEPLEVDYISIHRRVLLMAIAKGISLEYIVRKETLYYDESGNIKHLRIKDGKLNGAKDEVFVLGGVQAEDSITGEELKKALCRETETEIKSTKMLQGDFITILNKENCTNILQLIRDKGWHIHFNTVQVLYYAFVDIVDSINGLNDNPFEYKAILYEILKKDVNRTINHFKAYKYPNIKNIEQKAFLDEIIRMIDERIREDAEKQRMSPHCLHLKLCIEAAKNQIGLPFIQEEETHTWVKEFRQFYQQEIFTFPEKTLIFDEEKTVQAYLEHEETMLMDGKPLKNYSFAESGSNTMIQVCDLIVAILRKYIIFLDRTQQEVEKDIKNFREKQMFNYRLLNAILKESLEYNPMFFDFTASAHLMNKFYLYLERYN